MRQLVLLLLFSLPLFTLAQSAPDFTVTDIHGSTHTLYSQYLNPGKTVMLKIFYSTCPPCNAQADALQDLYESWGEGDHDVEFIEVSNKTWETDQTASTYVNNHGLTFPTVSAAGGSIPVVNSYINGGFGNFYGTPTYIVIAPDGSVNWDVEFADLDAALSATGAEKPGISGVSDNGNDSDLWIAPNPGTDFLNLYSKTRPTGEVKITVYNLLGGRLLTREPLPGSNTQILHEDVSGWQSGTYLVRIESKGVVLKTVRFVKK